MMFSLLILENIAYKIKQLKKQKILIKTFNG